MLKTERAVLKASLLAGVGSTLPGLSARAVNKGWHEPDNPASCYFCGLMGPCEHDAVVNVKRHKLTKEKVNARIAERAYNDQAR